jgi:hypothetical protein
MLPKLAGVVSLTIILINMIIMNYDFYYFYGTIKMKKIISWHKNFDNKSIVEKERHNKSKAKLEGCVFFNYGQDTPECQKEKTMATHPSIHPSIHPSSLKQISKP